MIKIHWRPEPRILRQFAWSSLVGFPFLALIFGVWKDVIPQTAVWILLGAGPVLLACALARFWPPVHAVYMALLLIAWPIGSVVSTVLLLVVFFGLITPFALFFRLRGRDSLHRRIDREVSSYWSERPGPPVPSRYFELY